MRNALCVHLTFGILVIITTTTNSFNIDVHIPIIKQGIDRPSSVNSYFGYSVSPHKIIEKRTYRVLVGAPLDNMTNYMSAEHPSGALYSCPITMATRDCKQILMLKPMRSHIIKNIHKHQWLGVNVVSDTAYDKNGYFAYTCGHRFMIQNKISAHLAVPGICMAIPNALVSSGLHRLVVLSPDLCDEPSDSKEEALCLRGTAFASRPDLGVIAMGAANEGSRVGAAHFANFPSNTGTMGTGPNAKLSFSSTEGRGRESLLSTYSGYAVSLGRILKHRRYNYTLVSGAPGLPSVRRPLSTAQWRAASAGQVALFGVKNKRQRLGDPRAANPEILPGEAFGSRFGHALLTLDLNGDGWDDLLVGAPNFETRRVSRELPSRVRGGGAVYLFLNKVTDASGQRELQLQRKFRPREMSRKACDRSGCAEAAFGSSLTALGDINLDGLPDIAVGAPGEDNGAVYIYHGHRTLGLSSEPTQVILASSLHPDLRGFGAAVAGGLDLDDNYYPDLVVGAPFSGHAVVLRSRPVLEVISYVVFVPAELDPGLLPSSAGLYDCPNGRCLEAKIYLTYKHAGSAAVGKQFSYKSIYSGEVYLELDEGKSLEESRVVFRNGGTRSFRQKVKFRHLKVAAKEPLFSLALFINPKAFMDKMTPISMRLSWSIDLMEPSRPTSGTVKLPNMNEYPIFNAAQANHSFLLRWKPTCATKGICTSDLNLSLNTSLERSPKNFAFLLGREDNFWLNFSISNKNEEAHMTFLNLDFSYRLVVLADKCPFPCQYREGLLRCPIANPLHRDAKAECRIHLSGSDIVPDTPMLNFSAWLTTVSKNMNSDTTSMNISANVRILANIQLKSIVAPEMVIYENLPIIGATSVTHENKIGPAINFTLTLGNEATSGVVPASNLTIYWPYELAGDFTEQHGKYLLYLVRQPLLETAFDNTLRCDRTAIDDIVNANNVRLYRKDLSNKRFVGKTLPDLVSGERHGRRFEICANGIARCRVIRCQVGRLSSKTGPIRLRFDARLWVHTMVEMFPSERHVPIVVNVTWSPDARYSVQQVHDKRTSIIMTVVASSALPPPLLPPNNLWLFVVIAMVAGLLLFGLIVLLLQKANFFRRDKRELEQRLAELAERREEEKHKYEYMEYD